MKKIDSQRFSGPASRCVEWFDPNIERTNREAPRLSFVGKDHAVKISKLFDVAAIICVAIH